MRIEFDRATDTAYVSLVDSPLVETSEPLRAWMVADLDASDRLVGIEILGASQHLDLDGIGAVVELAGTREAAEIFGVRPPNFIRDWARRVDFPKPLAELASTRVWDRRELVAYRDARRNVS